MTRLNVAIFRFNLKAIEPIILPSYKGSTIRGGFGNAFKRVSCAIRNKECTECLLKEKCVYSYVFETPLPIGASIMRKYRSVPHPFVIEPPPEKRRGYKPDDEIAFRLILIGKAIDYLPYFIYSFHELGEMGIGKGRGRFELCTVDSVERMDSAHEALKRIYDSKIKVLKPYNPMNVGIAINISGSNSDERKQLTMSFKTPTRISYNHHLTLVLEFHVLIRQLLRRLSLLAYFHSGGEQTGWDFKGIIKKAESVKVQKQNLRWYDWERYSVRQDTRMKMGGFIGDITFEGNIEPFLSVLKAGEILHVGKGTSFGLGKYEIQHIQSK